MISKRSVLGIACAALMSVAVVMPAMADPVNQDVQVNGEVGTTLDFYVYGGPVTFNKLLPGAISQQFLANNSLSAYIYTNVPGVNVTQCAAVGTEGGLGVDHLQFQIPEEGNGWQTFASDCDNKGSAWMGVPASNMNTGTDPSFTIEYAVNVSQSDPVGVFSYTTTFSADTI